MMNSFSIFDTELASDKKHKFSLELSLVSGNRSIESLGYQYKASGHDLENLIDTKDYSVLYSNANFVGETLQ